jgi:hypothetical protein
MVEGCLIISPPHKEDQLFPQASCPILKCDTVNIDQEIEKECIVKCDLKTSSHFHTIIRMSV